MLFLVQRMLTPIFISNLFFFYFTYTLLEATFQQTFNTHNYTRILKINKKIMPPGKTKENKSIRVGLILFFKQSKF